jgi:uncharacterized protein YjaZ
MRQLILRMRILAPAMFCAVLTSITACDRARPVQPGSPDQNLVVIDDASHALRDREPAIRAILVATLERVKTVLPVSGITITVMSNPRQTVPNYGVGGYTPDEGNIKIYIDPASSNSAAFAANLAQTLAHELHHAVRWKRPGFGRTLFEVMITEGLADRFAIELLGFSPGPWSNAISPERTAYFLDLAKTEFDSRSYDHDRWFFGTDASIPRWTGYTLGLRLVEAYQASHPGMTAAKLVHTPASLLRPT